MFRHAQATRPDRRAGVVLVIVLALLTLFALLGLSFIYYAQSLARSAEMAREAERPDQAGIDQEILLSYFLSQLLYDCPDDGSGVCSALRGHSLARSMYGASDLSPGTAFNGTGRLHAASPYPQIDDYMLVNYTYVAGDGFVRDPERLGWRTDLSQPRGAWTGGFNVPYTYPDLNNVFLAAVKADGTLLATSYHRPWTGFGSLDPANPNWLDQTKPWLKYMVLRPRPADMGSGFPSPGDAGGDVKNLIGTGGGNDSIWLDLDFPVLTTPAGRKYKPLFAPLVVDLDNRLNVNAHGNVRGRDGQGKPTHASHQGWGPWEVNPQYVLSQSAAGQSEWPRLFLGSAQPPMLGRYGGQPWKGIDGQPAPPPAYAEQPGTPPHFYAPLDFDGCDEINGYAASGPLLIPGDGAAPASSSFPTATAGYGNGSVAERAEHPSLFNVLAPAGDGRVFAAANLEALLRAGDAGAGGLYSELQRLCPANFAMPRTGRLVTTHSFDLDKPGVSAWLYDPASSGYQVAATAADQAPSGPAVAFPPLALRSAAPPVQSDFTPDWRAVRAGLERININRPLPPFPHQGSGSSPPFGAPLCGPGERFDSVQAASQFHDALFERQRLADNIYRSLLLVTGVPPAANPTAPSDQELMPRRWLAQLAANMVDFIDEDEISTPFNFYTAQDAYPQGQPPGLPPFDVGTLNGDAELPRYWVFGVELPRVVLNEVLAEYQEPVSPTTGAQYMVNLWAELHNPFPTAPAGDQPIDLAAVPLQVAALPGGSVARVANANAFLPYQVLVANSLRPRPLNDNVLGAPDQIRARTADVLDSAFSSAAVLMNGQPLPASMPSINAQGFFLLGAKNPPSDARNTIRAQSQGGTVPDATPILRLDSMQIPVTYTTPPARDPDDRATGLTVLLRRLANPHLPYDPSPTLTGASGDLEANPWYNPYVTIDYLESIPLRNAIDSTTVYASRGKRQPYAATLNPGDADNPVVDQVSAGITQHTFGLPNNPGPGSGHYDWLVHLDRAPVSALEFLQVSGCQPHQLTQRFIRGGTADQRFGHLVPWFDEQRRLYRLFEFLEARNRQSSVFDTRTAGRLNLNTLWDPEPFLALCDPQPGNRFTLQDLYSSGSSDTIFAKLLASRSPNTSPGPNDRPFLSLATGVVSAGDNQYPQGTGIDSTLLRSFDGGARRLFQPAIAATAPPADPARHPYVQNELLTKICNNVTTRSNVFAVWVTVGFFEVTDDSKRPVQLGAEIGRSEGRHVRHRLFAIVDRSVLTANPGPQSSYRPDDDPAVLYTNIIH
ncbi:MAG TPA: hypothetical protein VG099_14255 [Gemmataceae bacterium]|nr:hypothetical protein [Gemmataceae bacterium]